MTTVLIDIKNLPSARKTKEKFVKFSLDHKDFQFLFDNTIFEMKISNLEKNYKKAISLKDNCLKYSRTNYDRKLCYYILANNYIDFKQYDNGVIMFKEVLALFPNNAWAVGNVGYAYQVKKDYKNSLEYYEKAYSIKKYGAAKVSLSFLYTRIAKDLLMNKEPNNVYLAQNYIDKAEDLGFTGEAQTLFLAKTIWKQFKDPERAKKILIKGIDKKQESSVLRIDLADIYKELKDYDSAEQIFIDALKVKGAQNLDNKRKIYIAHGLAKMYLWPKDKNDEKKYDKAISVLEAISDIAKKKNILRAEYFYLLGTAYHEKGWNQKDIPSSRKAIKYYNMAIKFNAANSKKIHENIKRVNINLRNFIRKKM